MLSTGLTVKRRIGMRADLKEVLFLFLKLVRLEQDQLLLGWEQSSQRD